MSAVREAVFKVLDDADLYLLGDEERGALVNQLVNQLVSAVERVPVTVTVRDLDPTDPANTLTFTGGDLRYLSAMIGLGADRGEATLAIGHHLRVKTATGWGSPIHPDPAVADGLFESETR